MFKSVLATNKFDKIKPKLYHKTGRENMSKFDVVIIGGGIVGCAIFDELTLNGCKVALLEKGEDVSLGATRANSGIIHAGYDCEPKTLKAQFNVRGNQMFEKIAKRLGEKIQNCGSLVVCKKDELSGLEELKKRGEINGVKGLKILSGNSLKKLEPNLNENIEYGLFAPSAKLISPYNMCIAMCEEAILNGGKLLLNFNVQKIEKKDDFVISDGRTEVCAKFVINCTAWGVNEINQLVGEELLPVKLTKGAYILLDKQEKGLVNRPIFPLPTKKGKGILVCPTVSGNIFLGPTAEDIDEYETSTTQDEITLLKTKTKEMVDNINLRNIIRIYAGVRVKVGSDFYIEFGKKVKNFLIVAGICSPGLTASPAIAEYVLQKLKEKGLQTKKIKAVKRTPYTNIQNMDKNKLNELISKNSAYGKVMCKCETITEGEVMEVLNGPIQPLTTDGVKRRLRASMGRCQGSFCYPKILELMSKHYGIDQKDIIMKGKASVVVSDIKEGGVYESKL